MTEGTLMEGKRTRWLGPAKEEAISDAERRLGVRFPGEYREFLATHGCGIVDGVEIYGLGGPRGGVPDLDFVLEDLARRSFVRPRGLIPISEVGDGAYVMILAEDLQGRRVGEVVFWEPTRSSDLRLTPAASGFLAWLTTRLRPRQGP